MEYSGREEPQGAVGPSLDQVGQQFSYIGEDELPDVKNSKSPDSGRRNGTRPGKTRSGRNRQPRDTDYFIRILVPPTMVGAIIGKEGKKIKDLTDKTGTDITVHKKDDKTPFEKVVEIVGTPAQCSEANLSIHRTMRSETDPAKRSPVVEMRVLINSAIAGKLIGKQHCHLKCITDETGVTSVRAKKDDYNPLNHMDRVITIQCQLPPEPLTLDENTMLSPLEEEALSKCSQAENMVSTRADGCFKTLKREPGPHHHPHHHHPHQFFMQPQQGLWPHVQSHNMSNPYPPNWFRIAFGDSSQGYLLQEVPVKVHLTFPSKFAGPIIGKGASNLDHIKKWSGVSKVHVFPKDRDAPERYIEIIGTPFQQYFAQHLVYCKLAEEGYKTSTGENTAELKLKTEIFIPLKGGSKDQPNIIGRFIGKEGQNVKTLQRETGVKIKVLPVNENSENNEAVILIEESFATGQRAQMKILDSLAHCQSPPPRRHTPYS